MTPGQKLLTAAVWLLFLAQPAAAGYVIVRAFIDEAIGLWTFKLLVTVLLAAEAASFGWLALALPATQGVDRAAREKFRMVMAAVSTVLFGLTMTGVISLFMTR